MIDRVNRVALWLVGLILMTVSVVGLQARDDLFDIDLRQPGSIYERAKRGVSDEPWLWWSIIIVVSVLVAIVCLIWLRRQFARAGGSGIGTQTLARSRQGSLDVEPSSIAHAVAADFRTIDGVHDSTVRILELVPITVVRARLHLVEDADVHTIQQDAEQVFERLRTVTGSDAIDSRLRLRLADRAEPRVL